MQTEKAIILLKQVLALLEEDKGNSKTLDETSKQILKFIEQGVNSASEIGRQLGLSRQYISKKTREDLVLSGLVKIDFKGRYYIKEIREEVDKPKPRKFVKDSNERRWY